MFNRQLFISLINASGKTMEDVADALGISKTTLYRKMNGESDFYRSEMKAFCDFVGYKNPNPIFFAK